MDPDETQMFVEAYWWRWEMEDKMQAHYAAQHLSAATGKKLKPKKVKFLSEWHHEGSEDELEDGQPEGEQSQIKPSAKPSPKRSAEDDKKAFKRLKQFSKQRAAEHRGG